MLRLPRDPRDPRQLVGGRAKALAKSTGERGTCDKKSFTLFLLLFLSLLCCPSPDMCAHCRCLLFLSKTATVLCSLLAARLDAVAGRPCSHCCRCREATRICHSWPLLASVLRWCPPRAAPSAWLVALLLTLRRRRGLIPTAALLCLVAMPDSARVPMSVAPPVDLLPLH